MDWNELLEAFRRPLFPLGKTEVTLALILQCVGLVLAAFWGSALLRRILLARVLPRTRLDRGLQDALARIAGYVALAVGLVVGLSVIGIELTSLTVLAGALGVGVGFGLRNIIENFVSGLILLAERPIRLGDRIEVGDVTGEVVAIGARSTIVRSNDNISVIVPNSQLITEAVTNWGLGGDKRVRFKIAVGVGYGSEPREVERILLDVARSNPHVLRDPPPKVAFRAIGESSIDFELRVWTAELYDHPASIQSELYFAIWDAFKGARIEIPFPQRDLHLREPIRVESRQP
jgi:small-conductance mechanosensitive channel